MSFIMIIPTNVNAEEIIPVNISVKYGQTEARRILDMINVLTHGLGIRLIPNKLHIPV